jgi:hypothetical protein
MIRLISKSFPRLPMEPGAIVAWRAASEGDTEALDAFQAFRKFAWWEAPASVLFAGYATLNFLPPAAFSYFLPGCMISSMDEASEYDGYKLTVACPGYDSYQFDSLALTPIECVGW